MNVIQKETDSRILSGQYIRRYRISSYYGSREAVLILNERGNVTRVFIECDSDDEEVIEITDSYETNDYVSGYDLPFIIMNHPDFDEELEHEPWRGDNLQCYRDSIDELMKSTEGMDDYQALDILVCGHEACLEFDRFDMSIGAKLLKELILGKEWSLSCTEALNALIGLDGRIPAPWLKDCIPKSTLCDAMSSAITMDSIGYRSLQAMDEALPDAMQDIDHRYLLGLFDSFNEANYSIRRMVERGRKETASLLARALSQMKISLDHPLEMARLQTHLGIPDDDGLYIDAFVQEPSAHRLEEALAQHPEITVKELISMVWDPKSYNNPQKLLFFARNGMHSEVSDLILSDGYRTIDGLMDDDIDGLFQLAEVLLDTGDVTATAEICKRMLEFGKRSRDTFESVARVMWLMDDVCDTPGAPDWVEDYCSEYSRFWKTQSLWDAYGHPSNPHFSQEHRRYRYRHHPTYGTSCYPHSSSSIRICSPRIS